MLPILPILFILSILPMLFILSILFIRSVLSILCGAPGRPAYALDTAAGRHKKPCCFRGAGRPSVGRRFCS